MAANSVYSSWNPATMIHQLHDAIAGEAALSDASGSSSSGTAASVGASLAFNDNEGTTVESLIDDSTVSAAKSNRWKLKEKTWLTR